MGSGISFDFQGAGAKHQATLEDHEQLVLVFVTVQRWPEAPLSYELDNAEGTGGFAADFHGGEMIQEMKVLAFIGREH